MSHTRSSGLLHQVRTLFGSGVVAGLSDAELLDRFLSRSAAAEDAALAAEAAFAALVARHGPMVLGVCRRALADPNDVEDAFQATFLVLVRRARSVRVGDSLGRWLYGVARRVAAKAQARSAARSGAVRPARTRTGRPGTSGRPDRAAGGARRGSQPAAGEVPGAGRPLRSRGPDPRRGGRSGCAGRSAPSADGSREPAIC